ncbi:hypothetical protein [Bacillus sp. JCM 19034]|uniref:hypothetical protein n=1 Tax=Bacillus sp. JCM 19034 TaxID=1481928 RepID=UPI0007820CFC|nr:hypothetical protein [Bacillus sp. JCM 19034]
MAHRSKIALLSIIVQILTFSYLYIKNNQTLQNAQSLETEILVWSSFFLKLLGLSIAIIIIMTIVVNIFTKILSKESVFTVTDERDHLFEARSVRNFSYVFSLGFFLAMILVFITRSVTLLFHTFAFSYFVSGIILYLSYIFYYERGY